MMLDWSYNIHQIDRKRVKNVPFLTSQVQLLNEIMKNYENYKITDLLKVLRPKFILSNKCLKLLQKNDFPKDWKIVSIGRCFEEKSSKHFLFKSWLITPFFVLIKQPFDAIFN